MRIIFIGSGDFGIPTLKALAGGGDEVLAVFTQPPRPAGRGGHLRPTPIAELAELLRLPVVPAENINDPVHVETIRRTGADVIVVVDFGQFVRAPVRDAVPLSAFNLHGSLLPRLRGAAPVNWAIIRGEAQTGVTVFKLVDKMDAGAIYSQRAAPMDPDETAEQLRRRLSVLGVEAVVEALRKAAAGEPGIEQDHAAATLAPKLDKAVGVIDWTADASTIRNLIHGTWPWPGAHSGYVGADGRAATVALARARVIAGPGGQPGEIINSQTVATGDGHLEILQLKPAGGRLMDWRAFANGYRAGAGAKFVNLPREK